MLLVWFFCLLVLTHDHIYWQGVLIHPTGEIVEELEWKGKKGNAVKLLIGWTSKDEHMKFRDSQVFKDNIGLLREGNGGIEMFHVPFKAF